MAPDLYSPRFSNRRLFSFDPARTTARRHQPPAGDRGGLFTPPEDRRNPSGWGLAAQRTQPGVEAVLAVCPA